MNGDDSDRFLRFKDYDQFLSGTVYASDDQFITCSRQRRVFLEQGEQMGRDYQIARRVNQPYADSLYELWVTNKDYTQNLLNVMHTLSLTSPQPQPLPGPYPSGFSEIMSFKGDEIFCYWKGWAGTYGLHTGGAKLLYNGVEKQRFDRESIFVMKDGLATTEFFASILRLEDGVWQEKYSRPRRQDLMLGLARKASGQWVGLWTGWDNGTSGLVYSDDGETWRNGPLMTGRAFSGIWAEGDKIYLAGRIGTAQAVADEQGKAIATMDNGRGFWYWSICWPYAGTWNSNPKYGGYIDIISGSTLTQVYDNDSNPHRYIQSTVKIVDGSYLAVATNDWDAPKDKKTLLLRWKLGEKPKQILEIPLPHVMNLFPTPDGGADICGGRYQEFGKVLHWRP